jgi:hypothetical protein
VRPKLRSLTGLIVSKTKRGPDSTRISTISKGRLSQMHGRGCGLTSSNTPPVRAPPAIPPQPNIRGFDEREHRAYCTWQWSGSPVGFPKA